jgi:peptidoglycan/LPS O-acetylase OafA/YrhL
MADIEDSYDAFQNRRYFSTLNGLRALSVLAVVWHHTGAAGFTSGLAVRGELGVQLFFTISGFLVTTLLLREHGRHGTISLRAFYARRGLRIVPLYYAVLVLYIALTAATRRGTPEGTAFFEHLPAFATYTSNWFVELSASTAVTFYFAWSLAAEEQFYLWWPPLLAFTLNRRASLRVPLAAVATILAITTLARITTSTSSLPVVVLRSIPLSILLGVLGALLLARRPSFELLHPVLTARATAPALALGALAMVQFGADAQLIEVVLAAFVLSCAVDERGVLAPLLTFAPLARIGAVSYGVYLLHMLVSNVVRPFTGKGTLGEFALTVAGAIAVAEVSFRWFESPILRLKQRFSVSEPAEAAPANLYPIRPVSAQIGGHAALRSEAKRSA